MPTLYSTVNETGNRNGILEWCKFQFWLVHWIDPRSIEHIYACFFLLLSWFSSPNVRRRRLDVYHTSTHGVASANLECMSEMFCTRLAENTGRKKSPSRHHRTTLSGCVFATKACINNREKAVKQQSRPHVPAIWRTSAQYSG